MVHHWLPFAVFAMLGLMTPSAIASITDQIDYRNPNSSMENETDETKKSGNIIRTNDIVIGRNSSQMSAKGCRIEVPDEAVAELASVLSEPDGAVFVRLFVNVANASHEVDDDHHDNDTEEVMIHDNSRTLVWALDGKGALLLSFPGDFVFFSLGTLSPGVYDEGLRITVNGLDSECYWKASNAVKYIILGTFVIDLARAANASLTANDDLYAGLGFHVCVNKLDDFIQTRDLSRLFFNMHYEYMCLDADMGSISSEFHPVHKLSWLFVLRYIGYFLAFFSPLLGLIFTSDKHLIVRNPPCRNQNSLKGSKWSFRGDEHRTYYAINSDLPVGLRYLLFQSLGNSKICFLLRWSAAISAITVLPTWHILNCSFLLFNNKIRSFENIFDIRLYKSSSVFMIIVVGLFICSSFVILLHVCGSMAARRTINRMLNCRAEDLQNMTLVPWITVQKREDIPTIKGTRIKQFLLHLKYRAWMPFNPTIWKQLPTYVIFYFKKGVVSRGDIESELERRCVWGVFVKVSLRVVLLPLLILSSLPILNMFTPFVKEIIAFARGRRKITTWNLFGLLLFGITPIILFFSMAMMIVILIQILAYTFVGLLLNHNSIGKIAMVILVVTVFIVRSSLVLTSKYIELLRTVIEKAQEVEESCSVETEESADNTVDSGCDSVFQVSTPLGKVNDASGIELLPMTDDADDTPNTYLDTNSTLNTLIEIDTNGSVSVANQIDGSHSSTEEDNSLPNTCINSESEDKTCPTGQSLLSAGASDQEDEEDGPRDCSTQHSRSVSLVYVHKSSAHVSQHLFNKCVEAYLPLHVEVTKIVFRFILLCILLAFGLETLTFVEGTNDLPEVGDYFLLGAIPGLIELIESVLYSEAQREADDEAKWQTLEPFLEEYREQLLDQI